MHTPFLTISTFLLMFLAFNSTTYADHADSMSAANDPIADLADLYAFVEL
jgi:hypothetical protein